MWLALMAAGLLGLNMSHAQAQALTPVWYLVLDNKWYEVNPTDYFVEIMGGATAVMVPDSTQANCRRSNGQAGVPSQRLLVYGPIYQMVYLAGSQYYEWETIGNYKVRIFRATSSTGDIICDNALTEEPFPAGTADLAVSLVDSVDPVAPGAAFSYTATVFNAGPDEARSPSLLFTIPGEAVYNSAGGPGWSCTRSGVQVTCASLTSLAYGASSSASVNLLAPAAPGHTLNATVTASASSSDPNQANNVSTQSTQVSGTPASADLAISMTDAYDPVVASTAYAYTITVENLGPSTAANAEVTYTLPGPLTYVGTSAPGWTCSLTNRTLKCLRGNLPAGTSSQIVVSVTAPGTSTTLTNSVSVSAITPDEVGTNNTDTESTQIVTQSQSADLAVGVTNPGPQAGGAQYSYLVGVSNNGPMGTTAVEATFALPTGAAYNGASGAGWSCLPGAGSVTCTRANLANGASAPLTIQVTAPSTAGVAVFTANVRSARGDANLQNNTSSVTHQVNNPGWEPPLFEDGFEQYQVFRNGYEVEADEAD